MLANFCRCLYINFAPFNVKVVHFTVSILKFVSKNFVIWPNFFISILHDFFIWKFDRFENGTNILDVLKMNVPFFVMFWSLSNQSRTATLHVELEPTSIVHGHQHHNKHVLHFLDVIWIKFGGCQMSSLPRVICYKKCEQTSVIKPLPPSVHHLGWQPILSCPGQH